MTNRSRSMTMTLLIVATVLTLGPVGCRSNLPRQHWWQFWRPKSTQTLEPGKMVLPPPPDAAGAGTGLSTNLPPPISGDTLTGAGKRSGNTAQVAELHTVYFSYDSDQLSSEAQATLDGNLAWLQANANAEIQIAGHCDARGSTEYNLALGDRRAKNVMSYLVSKGIPQQRMTTISYGKENPAVPGDSEEAYSKNRRVEFLVYY
ncbi:peptidoglycan-associated lipoprotein Pal [bacterium]|nr:peptidoglycan-associated lipoprotein Pal [bacterium]